MFRFVVLILAVTANAAPNKGLENRIVGGKPTTIEEYPFQVSLHYLGFATCGGSIISQNFVITAAHCTNGLPAITLTVRAGSNTTDDNGQEIQVKKVYQNPQFDMTTMDYDISVLELYSSIRFGQAALPISLAPSKFTIRPGTKIEVTGWGTLTEGGNVPKELQVVEIPSISNEECQEAYKDFMVITERMICAKEELGGKDSCQGDSGGPLIADGLLVGVVSWGFGCANPEFPGVYTRISEFRDFIKNVTSL